MKQIARWIKNFLIVAFYLVAVAAPSYAADLPLAAASPLTGVSFDDRPLLLPVQRNFQMAMLTAGSELGRSCGKMEAYGWRMGQNEQGRVNQIFNNTVDRLRLLGYSITPQVLTSVSKDITLFTADHDDRHFMFLWSAGELGLVLNICQTTAPLPSSSRGNSLVPSVQVFPVPNDVAPARLDAMASSAAHAGSFSPLGQWVGTYICAQGNTGGTLSINELHGRDFTGIFAFYPTPKNPRSASGSYAVYGQYDKDSQRILINPGKWIKRPRNYYNTVIVGSFDPVRDSFSGFFQGISGCTSFEASRQGSVPEPAKPAHKKHAVKKKKPVAKKKPLPSPMSGAVAPVTEAPVTAPAVAAPAPEAPAPVTPAPAPVVMPSLQPAPAASNAPAVPVVPMQAPGLPDEDKKDSGGILLAPTGK